MPTELPISAAELEGIRLDVEQVFKDACRIERLLDFGTLDHSTAQFAGEQRSILYEGRCSVYPIMSRRDKFAEFGQGLIFTKQYRVVLPWNVADIQQRDRFFATDTDDPQLLNRELEVRDVVMSTMLGYRRLTVQDSQE